MSRNVLLAIAVAVAATHALDASARKPHPAKPAAAAAKAPEAVAVDVPPPSGNWEPAVAPANGHIWSVGYYEWKDGHYAWKAGEWVLAKEGMEYRQHKWLQRPDGKWTMTGGEWTGPGESVAGKQ